MIYGDFTHHIFNVPIKRSQIPDCCGLPGTLNRGVHPNIDKNVLVNSQLKFEAII